MLIVNNGRIEFEISHLEEEKMTTYNKILDRYSNRASTLFYHVVSSPDCSYEEKFGKGRVPEEHRKMPARNRLINILSHGVLNGNPKSYFVNKNVQGKSPDSIDEIKSVSFAFANMDELPHHFKARNSEYGIVFFHDFLQKNGIQEVIYLNNINDSGSKKRLVFNAPHLLEVYVPYYDNRWEKEWRIAKDLYFEDTDIAFVIVPDKDFDSFEQWMLDENINARIVPASLYTNSMDFLKAIPKVQSGWHGQIELDDGFIVDFDEYPEYTTEDRLALHEKCYRDLDALCKSFIQEIYEYAYVERFIKFAAKLDKPSMQKLGFENLNNFEANMNEPWHSSIDIIKRLYHELFHIQGDRIKWG